jgi:hypothetical protein
VQAASARRPVARSLMCMAQPFLLSREERCFRAAQQGGACSNPGKKQGFALGKVTRGFDAAVLRGAGHRARVM